MQRHILLAEDSEGTWRQVQGMLASEADISVKTVASGEDALQSLGEQNYSVFLTDLKTPRLDGMQVIEAIQKLAIPVTVVVLARHGSIDEAVQAMRLGAYDFLALPIDLRHLRLVVRRVLRERLLQDELVGMRQQLQSRYAFHNILSKNPKMHAVFELITNVAQTNTTILVEGETGTGKEEVARAIHNASHVRIGPLIAVNCAAVPETLLESELFGHEKGAFTSAVQMRRGRFELAQGGSLFLDEVGDIPAPMQAKLLRVLQERRFERVGGTESIEVDVRVIAATNRSLSRLVAVGQFREDLYYRLNVVKIDLPPLRERAEDIPLLAAFFAQKYARAGEPAKPISPDGMEALLQYRWPGNIRELENAIERACVTCASTAINRDNLPGEVLNRDKPKLPFAIDFQKSLPELLDAVHAELEEAYIRKALEQCHGHVGRCAQMCGMSRRSLSAKIAEYGIDKAVYRTSGRLVGRPPGRLPTPRPAAVDSPG
jgi:DNA-binding NtrC family response regulator